MPADLKLSGVDEFLKELEALAPDLATEAGPLQAEHADAAAAELRAAYPERTGELRRSIQVARESSHSAYRRFTSVSILSPYAGFYEFGTSRSAPHPTFTPIMRRSREGFLSAIIARVRARGLTVQGGPANA